MKNVKQWSLLFLISSFYLFSIITFCFEKAIIDMANCMNTPFQVNVRSFKRYVKCFSACYYCTCSSPLLLIVGSGYRSGSGGVIFHALILILTTVIYLTEVGVIYLHELYSGVYSDTCKLTCHCMINRVCQKPGPDCCIHQISPKLSRRRIPRYGKNLYIYSQGFQ